MSGNERDWDDDEGEFECAKCGFWFPCELRWWGNSDYEGEPLCPDCFAEEQVH